MVKRYRSIAIARTGEPSPPMIFNGSAMNSTVGDLSWLRYASPSMIRTPPLKSIWCTSVSSDRSLTSATEGGSTFRAHDKASGEILHEMDLGANQSGMPMTYAIDGRQYIVVAVGAQDRAGELVALSIPRDLSQ